MNVLPFSGHLIRNNVLLHLALVKSSHERSAGSSLECLVQGTHVDMNSEDTSHWSPHCASPPSSLKPAVGVS